MSTKNHPIIFRIMGLSWEWIPCSNLYNVLLFTELSYSLSHQTFTRRRHDQFLLCPFNRKGYWHWERLKLNHRLPIWHTDKEPSCQWRRCKRHRFDPWLGKISWGGKWQLTPVFLAWEISWTEQPRGLLSVRSQSWTQPRTWGHTHTKLTRDRTGA